MKNANSLSVLTEFYLKNRLRLFNFLRKSVNEPDAQDILHDGFILAWQNISKFQEKAKISTWFYAILRNLVNAFYNRKHRANQHRTDTVNDNLYHSFEPDLHTELKSLVQKAVESLPNPNHRQIITLRYYQNLKLTQIHKHLRLRYKTTEMQHRRALKNLKDLILKDPTFGGLLEYV